jgi:tetratricopeptide (TPR) repeat protein
VLTNASLFFAEVGRMGESLAYAKRAYEIDPMYPWAANWYATTLDYSGRSDEGRVLWERFCALWPDNELISWNAIAEAAARGDWIWFDDLVAKARSRGLDTPTFQRVTAFGSALRQSGPEIQARTLDGARKTLRATGTLPHSSFILLYRLGLTDEVFGLIDQASFAYLHDPDMCTPNGRVSDGLIFSVLHNVAMIRDARFVRLCARLGLCHYWMTTGSWPDCAEMMAPYYEFKAEAKRLASQPASA